MYVDAAKGRGNGPGVYFVVSRHDQIDRPIDTGSCPIRPMLVAQDHDAYKLSHAHPPIPLLEHDELSRFRPVNLFSDRGAAAFGK